MGTLSAFPDELPEQEAEALFAAMLKELEAADAAERRKSGHAAKLKLFINPMQLVAIVGHVRLALKHPQNNGPGAREAELFIKGVIEGLRFHHFDATADFVEKVQR